MFVLLHGEEVTIQLVGTVLVLVQVMPSFRRRAPSLLGIVVLSAHDIFQVVDLCVPNEFSCLPVTPDVTSYMSGTIWECGLEGAFRCLFCKP